MNTYERILKELNGIVEQEGGNKAALMRRAGVDPEKEKSKFYKFLAGNTVPSADTFVEWLERMGFRIAPPDERLEDFEMIPKVEAQAGAGSSLITSGEILAYYAFRCDFLRQARIPPKDAVMLDVIGHSMEPLIRHRDTILVDRSKRELRDGEIFLVGLGDELLVKRVQRTPRGWLLRSENKDFADIPVDGPDLEAFRVYGRVRWFGRVL